MNIRTVFGRVSYVLSYPLLLLILRGSTRAYVLLLLNDKILLTQSTLDYASRWHLVGGGIKKGETLAHGAVREVKEELGIDIDESKLVSLGNGMLRAKNNYDYGLFFYPLDEEPKLKLRKSEITNAKFFTIQEIPKIQTSDTVQKALQLLALK